MKYSAFVLMLISSLSFGQVVPGSPVDLSIVMAPGTGAAAQGWGYATSDSSATGGSANNTGNNQLVRVENSTNQVHQAPAVMMGAMFPTAACQATVQAFLSAFIFGGAGGGFSYTLQQCELREIARHFAAFNEVEAAVETLCMADYAKDTARCQRYKKEETIETD